MFNLKDMRRLAAKCLKEPNCAKITLDYEKYSTGSFLSLKKHTAHGMEIRASFRVTFSKCDPLDLALDAAPLDTEKRLDFLISKLGSDYPFNNEKESDSEDSTETPEGSPEVADESSEVSECSSESKSQPIEAKEAPQSQSKNSESPSSRTTDSTENENSGEQGLGQGCGDAGRNPTDNESKAFPSHEEGESLTGGTGTESETLRTDKLDRAADLMVANKMREVVRKLQEQNLEPSNTIREATSPNASFRSSKEYGGEFFNDRASCDNRLSKKIAKEINRILKDSLGTFGESSPRLDSKKLVHEIVSKRYALPQCKKQEMSKSYGCLAIDVSGSCSSYSYELVAAARLAIKGDDRLTLLLHSNGDPVAWITPWEVSYVENTYLPIEAFIKSHDFDLVIWVGDGDGVEEAAALMQTNPKSRLVWLDNYCASYGVSKASKGLRGFYNGFLDDKEAFQGVGNPLSVLEALREVK